MTLLITVLAAAVSTILWYRNAPKSEMRLGILCLMYWGASLMWLVDAVFEFVELGSAYFRPALADMANDAFLGLSAVALGLVIWLAILLIKDPKGVIRKTRAN
ncbi:MAG: hypothetical protein ILO68_06705 [Clostridia bacterium]|nr:hypothetical protein [Clostridia bacterium]